jgi:hypothetical protein
MNTKPLKNQRVRAILIDPEKQQIHEIEFAGTTQLYQIIGCDHLEAFKSYWQSESNDETMYFDGEALIKNIFENNYAVGHTLLPVENVLPIIGRVVICRISENGTHLDTGLKSHKIRQTTRFYLVPPKRK